MTSATLNIKIAPRRMLSAGEAASYCGLPLKRFPTECNVTPVAMPGGRKLYDIRELDTWLDALKGGAGENDNEILDRLS
jgi:hypothetical protein